MEQGIVPHSGQVMMGVDENGAARFMKTSPTGATALQDGLEVSGSVTALGTLFSQDTTGYASVAVQVTSSGSATIAYEASNDSTTWYAVAGYTPLNVTSVSVTTSTTTLLLVFPCTAKYFRARCSSYTSGTVAATAYFRKDELPRHTVMIGGDNSGATPKEVIGDAAHDAAISGNPVRLGGRARTSMYTAVINDDTADLVVTTVGALITRPYSLPEADWSFASAASGIVNTTTAVTIKAAAGAGVRNYLTSLQIATDTLGAATEIAIRDGAGGTIIWRGKLQTTALPMVNIEFPNPLKSTGNTLLEVVTLTAVTGGVYVNAQGYAAP